MSRHPEQFEPDPVIEAYKRDVDRTLIRENLRLTVEERFDRLMRLQQFAEELQRGRRDMEVNSDLTEKFKGKRYQMKDGTIITVAISSKVKVALFTKRFTTKRIRTPVTQGEANVLFSFLNR
jgi:hypothetical protein